jgi:hypothetical protein
MSAIRIIGHSFFSDTIYSDQHVARILTPLFQILSDYERIYSLLGKALQQLTPKNTLNCIFHNDISSVNHEYINP